MRRFSIADASFDVAPLRERLSSPKAGACIDFEGRVRNINEGRPVVALTYEAYVALAETEGEKVLADAVARFEIVEAVAVHRIGRLALGDLAVWVGVSAGHRDGAYAASRWIIDEIKARVPIWKHEHYADGDAGWLHPEPSPVARP